MADINIEKTCVTGEFDHSGRYDSGLQALTKSLRVAFLLLLLGIILTLIYFFSGAGYFSVEPQQAVIVSRFGKIVGTYTTGAHWFLPYPVNQFIRVQTNQQLLDVDFNASAAVPAENLSALEPGRDRYLLTGDANIVHSSWTIAYRISDPAKYYTVLMTPQFPVVNGCVVPDDEFIDADGLKGTRGPRTFIVNLFRNSVIAVTNRSRVDDILYAGQGAYSEAVQKHFADSVNAAGCGIVVDSVGLNRIYPPARTKGAFDEVTAAGNTRSALRNEAEAYRIEVENDTTGAAAAVIADAENYKTHIQARTEAEKTYFSKILKQYRRNPGAVAMELHTSLLREVAQQISGDKFILGTGNRGKKLWLKLNPEPKNAPGANAVAGEEK